MDEVWLDVGRFDPVSQRLDETPRAPDAGRRAAVPDRHPLRLAGELDLMARIAGLRLHERWGGWSGEPFTGDSRLHVSVYGR